MESLRVSNGNEMSFADIRDDRDISGEVEIDGKRDEFEERKEIFGFNKGYVKNEDYRLFFWPVNERNFKFVEVGRLVNEIVEFVFGSCVLDVVEDGVQNINTESPWSQFLIEGSVDDSLKNCHHGSEHVGVRNDLSNGLVDTKMKARLYLEGF